MDQDEDMKSAEGSPPDLLNINPEDMRNAEEAPPDLLPNVNPEGMDSGEKTPPDLLIKINPETGEKEYERFDSRRPHSGGSKAKNDVENAGEASVVLDDEMMENFYGQCYHMNFESGKSSRVSIKNIKHRCKFSQYRASEERSDSDEESGMSDISLCSDKSSCGTTACNLEGASRNKYFNKHLNSLPGFDYAEKISSLLTLAELLDNRDDENIQQAHDPAVLNEVILNNYPDHPEIDSRRRPGTPMPSRFSFNERPETPIKMQESACKSSDQHSQRLKSFTKSEQNPHTSSQRAFISRRLDFSSHLLNSESPRKYDRLSKPDTCSTISSSNINSKNRLPTNSATSNSTDLPIRVSNSLLRLSQRNHAPTTENVNLPSSNILRGESSNFRDLPSIFSNSTISNSNELPLRVSNALLRLSQQRRALTTGRINLPSSNDLREESSNSWELPSTSSNHDIHCIKECHHLNTCSSNRNNNETEVLNFPESDVQDKFSSSCELPSTSSAKEYRNSNSCMSGSRNAGNKYASLSDLPSTSKISCFPQSQNPNRTFKSARKLIFEDSDTSSDEEKENFPIKIDPQKETKTFSFYLSNSSENQSISEKTDCDENFLENKLPSASHCESSGEQSSKLDEMEVINSENITTIRPPRKRLISSIKALDIENEDSESEKKKSKQSTSSD